MKKDLGVPTFFLPSKGDTEYYLGAVNFFSLVFSKNEKFKFLFIYLFICL